MTSAFGLYPSETRVWDQMVTAGGYTMLRDAWPDFLAIKQDAEGRVVEARAVEAKSYGDKLTTMQKLVLQALSAPTFRCEVAVVNGERIRYLPWRHVTARIPSVPSSSVHAVARQLFSWSCVRCKASGTTCERMRARAEHRETGCEGYLLMAKCEESPPIDTMG